MALTRLRFVAGDRVVGEKAQALAYQAIAGSRDLDKTRADILDMRRRIARDKPPADGWDLKLGHGGIVDLEFIVQQELLLSGTPDIVRPSLLEAIDALLKAGRLTDGEAELVSSAQLFLQALQQIQRVTLGQDGLPEPVSNALRDRLCRAVAVSDFAALETKKTQTMEAVAALRLQKIGSLTTES